MTTQNIAVIGSSGAIGSALTQELATTFTGASIYTFSRSEPTRHHKQGIHTIIDYDDESSIRAAAITAARKGPLDIVLIATGMLYDDLLMPEKSLNDLSAEKFARLFTVNSILPAILAKHFIPRLNKHSRSLFAALSARVGSISDNRLGGWYAYRASKAALNMIIKNAAIETTRRNKAAIIVGLHPGTVDSHLSKPFQGNVPEHRLFSPEFSAAQLIQVLAGLTADSSGKCFAWDGKEITP
ncbi:SDR family NAD(P)-dependent oxidoreductase [Thalassomonas haliotis]|uniref:SDR family NAD(P)-dependent oxidoreductase n=1 Tax=Thalassomonas haliotis TaxID=485448 RepID=A0ABY7VII9_9GAMM|nr:SDR family NAD(P)-dependent oxidoreductase [Thalassomonas haliotis]WDE13559.1 SDR family NAD(P)-dependent oxidoreductase [Thalassomonas haliotis]